MLHNSAILVVLLLLTGVLSNAVHVIDRSSNWQSDVFAMTLWTALVQLLLVLPFIGLVSAIPWWTAIVLLCVAMLTAYARNRWYLALAVSGDSLSRLLPLTHASSFIVLILAAAFLSEPISVASAVGGSIMIAGAMVITLEQPGATIKEFAAANLSLLFVLVLSFSRAINNVSYKWIFNQGAFDFFTVYFFLKLFELAATLLMALCSARLRASYNRISHPQAFVGARGVQTLSGLLFIYVLNNMAISLAEPISASGPVFAIAWEWLDHRYGIVQRLGGRPPPLKTISRAAWAMRLTGTGLILGGFLLLQ